MPLFRAFFQNVAALCHIGTVAPFVAADIADYRCALCERFAVEAVGIRLHAESAVRPRYGIFVFVSFESAGSLYLAVPDTVFLILLHRVFAFAPRVEVADEINAFCIRRPEAEGICIFPAALGHVRSEVVIRVKIHTSAKKYRCHIRVFLQTIHCPSIL